MMANTSQFNSMGNPTEVKFHFFRTRKELLAFLTREPRARNVVDVDLKIEGNFYLKIFAKIEDPPKIILIWIFYKRSILTFDIAFCDQPN